MSDNPASSQSPIPALSKVEGAKLLIIAVVLLAIGLRLWFWSWQARSGAVQPADPEEYYRAALHILQGGYHDTGKWLRPPLYPAFLGLMFVLGGIDVSFALLGQALLSGLGVLAFIALGSWLFDRRDAGLLSGLIAATFVPLASFGSVLFAEALFTLLIILGLALFDRAMVKASWRWALACGAVLGLAALTRAVAVFFIPVAALLLILGRWTSGRQTMDDRRLSSPGAIVNRQSPIVGAFILGAFLVIGPWTIRNYLVHQRFILVDTNGGISMWYGTVRGEQDQLQGEAKIFAQPNLADRQSLALRMTAKRVLADPGFFLSRVRFKIASLFLLQSRSFATGEVVTISPPDEQIALSAGENPLWLSLIADTQYVLIMLSAIVGICFVPSWRRALPALAWFLIGVALAAITVAHHRLRLPLVGALIPFSAYAFVIGVGKRRQWALQWRDNKGVRLRQGATSYGLRALLAFVGCAAFCGLIFSFRYLTWAQGERYALAGRQALERDDYSAAQASFEQARAADPANALRLIDLADLAFDRGDLAQATALFSTATQLEHRSLYAHAMIIQAAALRKQPDVARAALTAIDGYGRDNNDLYRWAWNTPRTPAPSRVVPGDPMFLGHYEGFAPATFDLSQGRWTLDQGRLRLRGSCGELRLALHGPAGRVAQIWIEEWNIQRTIMLNGTPQEVTLPLSSIRDCEAAPPLVVQVQSDTSLLDLERAPWAVGVAVLEARVGG